MLSAGRRAILCAAFLLGLPLSGQLQFVADSNGLEILRAVALDDFSTHMKQGGSLFTYPRQSHMGPLAATQDISHQMDRWFLTGIHPDFADSDTGAVALFAVYWAGSQMEAADDLSTDGIRDRRFLTNSGKMHLTQGLKLAKRGDPRFRAEYERCKAALHLPLQPSVSFGAVADQIPAHPAQGVILAAAGANGCYREGDIIKVRGRIDISGHFDLLHGICMDYPDASKTMSAGSLETIGKRLDPNVYLEVTGELRDSMENGHRYGLDIRVLSSSDIELEELARKRAADKSCRDWQAANRPEIISRTHGGTADPINPAVVNGKRRCGIWGIDQRMPHDSVTLWRQ